VRVFVTRRIGEAGFLDIEASIGESGGGFGDGEAVFFLSLSSSFSSLLFSQSNPLPIEVTPQLPTLAALYNLGVEFQSSLSKVKSTCVCVSMEIVDGGEERERPGKIRGTRR
jgi:hypothetical protein